MTRLPLAVLDGMFLAAWAQAECCEVVAREGMLELSARYSPSDELESAFEGHARDLRGVVGCAVPLQRGTVLRGSPRCSVVQWSTRGWGVVGAWGMS